MFPKVANQNVTNLIGAPARTLLLTLRAQRAARLEDDRVRLTLGLRYVGLKYGPFGQAPVELYRGSDGQYFVKVQLGVYKEADK